MANYELIFIRHGEHKGGDCIIPELTADGVAGLLCVSSLRRTYGSFPDSRESKN